MKRNTITSLLFLGVAQVVAPGVWNMGVVPGIAPAQAADAVGTSASAIPQEQFVVRDTFDDNKAGPMWQVLATDPSSCSLQEINQRLELRITAPVADASASYISQGWRLDSRRDFTIKVDWYFNTGDRAGSWLSFGVTPDAGNPWEKNVVVGVGYKDYFARCWYRGQNGLLLNTGMAERDATSGPMVLSYNAALDELYVGFAEGAENAWRVFPGLLKGQWGSRPLFMWLAGGSTGATVTSGQAYLDNLRVNTGTVIEASLAQVHRFWSPVTDEHFYTISEEEKEFLRTQYGHVWKYQGPVYQAYPEDCDPDTAAVYRFWSPRLGTHFYTINPAERDWLIAEYPHVWSYEGLAFYVYPEGKQPAWAQPVYRLWSADKNYHLYTMNKAERDNLLTKYPHLWTDEGIAWYALP